MDRASAAAFTSYTVVAAFSVYFCMYAFRKPFAVATYEGRTELPGLPPMDTKVLFIIAQVIGYCLSKFVGIKVISEMTRRGRGLAILACIGVAEGALALFATTPAPWNAFWLFVNGLPLGLVWGLVFGFLEGRRVSEVLGAGLSASFIVASGATKSVGIWVMAQGVSEMWMPFVTGAIFVLPMLLFVRMLSLVPPPTVADEALRTRREPMGRVARNRFVRAHAPGLIFLTVLYMALTAYRDFRDNFSRELWDAMGAGEQAAVYTQTEIIVAFAVLVALATIMAIRRNRAALLAVQVIMLGGSVLIGASTWAFQTHLISPLTWMTLVGTGLYLGYVPYGCVLFDRLIAALGEVANAGFLIYFADAFGYLGSVAILLFKTFGQAELSWLEFFVTFSYATSILCTVCFVLAIGYFYRRLAPERAPDLSVDLLAVGAVSPEESP
ncbi:MAG: hypothetical protein H6744_15130 [Deltaproteobacteria bacterium]|nr:hypothetical protein [Deltaproteobacteria bacterium]MCB9788014.1 hypothetical protein [Deltaproteobacteria bacterium]